MRRLGLVWLFGIALLGLEMSAMLWARDHVRTAEAKESGTELSSAPIKHQN